MIAKTPCQQCGVNIEFEAESANQVVQCPSCGKQTRLLMPGTAEHALTSHAARVLDKSNQSPILPARTSRIAMALTICAMVEFVGSIVAGIIISSDGGAISGFAFFIGSIVGGIMLLALADIVENSKVCATSLQRIELLIQKNQNGSKT